MSFPNDLRLAGGKQQREEKQRIPARFNCLHTMHILPFCKAEPVSRAWKTAPLAEAMWVLFGSGQGCAGLSKRARQVSWM